MPDDQPTLGELSKAQLDELVDNTVAEQLRQRVSYGAELEMIARNPSPAIRGAAQIEMLHRAAVETLGMETHYCREALAAILVLENVAVLFKALADAARRGAGSAASKIITARAMKDFVQASCRTVLFADVDGPAMARLFSIDEFHPRRTIRREVWETVAIELLMRYGGLLIADAAREVSAELRRRRVPRSPGALTKAREKIKKWGARAQAAATPRDPREAKHLLNDWSQRPPAFQGRSYNRSEGDPGRQQFFNQQWAIAAAAVEALLGEGNSKSEAARRAMKLVLDQIAPDHPRQEADDPNQRTTGPKLP
jgi:hypothetical protein